MTYTKAHIRKILSAPTHSGRGAQLYTAMLREAFASLVKLLATSSSILPTATCAVDHLTIIPSTRSQ